MDLASAASAPRCLLITPIPRAREAPTTPRARSDVAVDLARIFELPLERVLIPAPLMRSDLFVSRTHLTARGHQIYTGVLARRLEKTRCFETYESRGSSR